MQSARADILYLCLHLQLFARVKAQKDKLQAWDRLDKIALMLRLRGGRVVGKGFCEGDECS